MIARIAGILEELSGSSALLALPGGLWYEVLVCAGDVEKLRPHLGQEVCFHTVHHIEGDPSRGQVTPRLIGFRSESDREFFRAFTTVKGIGIRKALRCLLRPIPEVASAIAAKDAKFLATLPEIGRRTAEQIIASLHDRMDEWAAESVASAADGGAEPAEVLGEAWREAVAVLTQLGERADDAAEWVRRVQAVDPDLQSPEAIIQQVYRLKGA